jgi:hypothetical protein
MTGTTIRDKRQATLLPDGIPRWVRIYDNGGESIDRYTAVFTGRYRHKTAGQVQYVGMNAAPFHPQGFGQHGESPDPIDTNRWGFAPAMGRKNHLGTRIVFTDLPPDCQRLVLSDYRDLWDLS